MTSQEFQFVPPPEAPTFRPTWEEFQDALQYINKIRPVAEQYGICKIIPPPDWQPPFAVDVDNFKFTPRIQRLNELEAHTRIKLNFLDQIAKFWELQGSSLKIPVLEKKALDLYSLHRKVQDAGGAENVSKTRGWNRIAYALGFNSQKNLGTQLKQLYERILQPFDIFNRSKEVPVGGEREPNDDDPDYVVEPRDYKPHQIPSRMAGKIPDNEKNGRRSRRYQTPGAEGEDDEDCSPNCKELKRLQFKGPGPKNADVDKDTKTKGRSRKSLFYDHDPLAKYICLNCGRGDAEEHMLLCDGCDDSYHTFCLMPSLTEIPKGDWRCPKCVAVEVSKPLEAFGFEQAQKEYNLQSFGEMADKFKQDYFNMPVHLVPLDMAEREFWRIVSSIDEDVTVEYGADLHTMDHGSGFPTQSSSNLMPADQEYASDSWNLNNLPVQEGSVLAHIGCDISGMKVPWMYVGMCFSTFCWHNEDHWSYSINYLHWGEPKTWYGVPGGEAEKFEECMKSAAPELFMSQPDLLHQLVTIMNPNILMRGDVPIVRCDQHAGEFMITFPRSYHAGFNQGYNFAEAVNFAPPDWLSIGRECIQHYSNLKRYCVFSHDELVCKMAASPDSLDLTVAAATYQDMLKMVDAEKRLRKSLLHMGVSNAEREAFELLPDDERQCDYCKTTCFLSAVTCPCSPAKLVCLRHYSSLCDCDPGQRTLRYRYTLDELPPLLQKLKERAESFDNWASKVKQALEAKQPEDKLELEELRELVSTAEERRFPDSELLGALLAAVAEADKCAAVALHLAAKKVRTRTRGSGDPKSRLTLIELQLFYDQINSLACSIKEAEGVKSLLDTVTHFQEQAGKALLDSDKWLADWQMRRDSDEDDTSGSKQDLDCKVKLEPVDEGEPMEVDEDSVSHSSANSSTKKKKKRPTAASAAEDAVTEAAAASDGDKENTSAAAGKNGSDDDPSTCPEKDQDGDVKMEEEIKEKLKDETSEEEEEDLVQSEELSRLLEAGLSLDIDLPELPRLRYRLQKVTWLEEVEDNLDPPSAVTADVVKQLLAKSQQLPPHRRIEHTRALLQGLLQDIETWDSKAAALLHTKQCSVVEAEELLKEADQVLAHLPAVASLRDAVKKAREWQAKAAAIGGRCQPLDNKPTGAAATKAGIAAACKAGYGGDKASNGEVASGGSAATNGTSTTPASATAAKQAVPVLEVVEALLHRARPIPLKLPELEVLEEEVAAAQAWLDKTARTFLKKNSPFSLIEVLVPRTEIGLVSCSSKRKRVKRDDLTTLQQVAALLDMTPDHAANSSLLVQSYKDCGDREVKAVRAFRAHNLSKRYDHHSSGGLEGSSSPRDGNSSGDELPPTFCVCHKPATPGMMQCTVCCDRFHAGCVPHGRHGPSSSHVVDSSGRESSVPRIQFICPSCHRSRRPRLDTILQLLMALQEIHVRLCEAGALQCLTERAMSWQDRAQHLLQTPELSAGMATMSHASSLLNRNKATEDSSSASPERPWGSSPGQAGSTAIPAAATGASEHGYSSPSGDGSSSSSAASCMSAARITSLLSSLCSGPDQPLLTISASTRHAMRDVLLEGELLEVTMDETLHLWRLLQMAEFPVSKISQILVELDMIGGGGTAGGGAAAAGEVKMKKSAAKKRKSQGGHQQQQQQQQEAAAVAGDASATASASKVQKTSKSPKRTKAGAAVASTASVPTNNNNTNNTANNNTNNSKPDDTTSGPPKKILKKKANSASKLPDLKRKEPAGAAAAGGSHGAGAAINSQTKKKRPLAVSQSSSSINNASSNTTNTNASKANGPPKSPKKMNNTNSAAVGGSSVSNRGSAVAANSTKTGSNLNSGNSNNSTNAANKKQARTQYSQSSSTSGTSSTSSSDDDELCAAARCKIPVGASVDWVQCDMCNGWFHYVCVGLKSTDLGEEDDYLCIMCCNTTTRSTAKPSSNASKS